MLSPRRRPVGIIRRSVAFPVDSLVLDVAESYEVIRVVIRVVPVDMMDVEPNLATVLTADTAAVVIPFEYPVANLRPL
jgi:hypothetical protein